MPGRCESEIELRFETRPVSLLVRAHLAKHKEIHTEKLPAYAPKTNSGDGSTNRGLPARL